MIRSIWLAPNEPKCSGSACSYPKPCARRDIPADKGRILADFSQKVGYAAVECCGPSWARFVSYEAAKKPEAAPVIKGWIGR